MKTALVIASVLAVAIGCSVSAADNSKETKGGKSAPVKTEKKAKTKSSRREEHRQTVLMTGSYIPQRVNRNGVVTDTTSPVVYLDRATIEASGAADLRQVLVRRGIH